MQHGARRGYFLGIFAAAWFVLGPAIISPSPMLLGIERLWYASAVADSRTSVRQSITALWHIRGVRLMQHGTRKGFVP
jgi:hypothetical protein